MMPVQTAELISLLHAYGQDSVLAELATDAAMYAAPGPKITRLGLGYGSQAEIALMGLRQRKFEKSASSSGVDAVLLQILRTLSDSKYIGFADEVLFPLSDFLEERSTAPLPQDIATWPDFSSLARRLTERLAKMKKYESERERAIAALNAWADALERAMKKSGGDNEA